MTEADSRLSLSNGIRQRLFWQSALPQSQTYIYFIQDDPGTPVKIGYTNRVGARIKALQTGNSRELRLIAVLPAPPCIETAYHRQLGSERVLGEWFKGPMTDVLVSKACDLAERMINAYDHSGRTPDIYDFDDSLERPTLGPSNRPSPVKMPDVRVVKGGVQLGRVNRPKKRGIPSGAFDGHGLQSRWRLTPDSDAEVVIKHVDPTTMDRTPSRVGGPRERIPRTLPSRPEGDRPWTRKTMPDWLKDAA